MCIREAAANVPGNSSAQSDRWNRRGRLGAGANSSGIGRRLSLVLTVSTHALGCGSSKWVRDTGTALLVSTLSKEQMWLVCFRWITCPGKGGSKSRG